MTSTMAVVRARFEDRPFTLQQAMQAGLTRSALRNACRRGRLLHLGRAVYQEAPADLHRPDKSAFLDRIAMAALRHPDAIFSHDSAAALHGLWCPWITGWREVTTTMSSYGCLQAGARVMRRTIDRHDITTVAGIACTTPARTALDIAAQTTLAEALVVIDSFGRLGAPTRRQALDPSLRATVRDELLHAATRMRGLRGIERARRAAVLANPAAESAPESYARGLFLAAGYPEPEVGRPIRGADGRTYYADLCWPERRLIVEIDGADKYRAPSDTIGEKHREDAIRAAEWLVHRIWAIRLWAEPAQVLSGLDERWAAW